MRIKFSFLLRIFSRKREFISQDEISQDVISQYEISEKFLK